MLKLGIFFGGESCEHDISIITALQVLENADKSKYDVIPIYIRNGVWYTGEMDSVEFFKNFDKSKKKEIILSGNQLYSKTKFGKFAKYKKIDVAFIANHGGDGENGDLQGLLEVNGIAYTSCDVYSSALCMDKDKLKKRLESSGYPTVAGVTLKRSEYNDKKSKSFVNAVRKLSYPLIVKPATLGSSIGITVAENRAQLNNALTTAFCYDDKALIEKYIKRNSEYSCACCTGEDGNVIVSAIEKPLSKAAILSFADKYSSGGKNDIKREMPAKIDYESASEIRDITRRLYETLGLFGVVRIDYIYDEDERKLYVNEINTVPGSIAYYLFEECGISFERLIDMMTDAALKRYEEKNKNLKTYISNVLEGNFEISK